MSSPVDRRLVRESPPARSHLAVAAMLGVLEAGLILAQAVLLATIIARAVRSGAGIRTLEGELIALVAVLAGRALVRAGFELSGRVGAIRVMSELRGRLVAHLLVAAPGQRPHDVRTGELAADAIQGVDALEAYFAGYLPQLILAVVVPAAVLVWVAGTDPITAVILGVTVPILIGFMILIGKGSAAQSRLRMGALDQLSAHFLDVVQGLPTLRAYRRERVQEQVLGAVGDRYRRETVATLRIAFLSALVLELCAMLGTAMLAATVGVQLVGGHLTLRAGLTVLLLAPELYGPLRLVGQQFHASADGAAAAERIFTTLEQPVPVATAAGAAPAPCPDRAAVLLQGVAYEYPGRPGAVLRDVDLRLEPGTITALVGESGSGKSTIARLVLRLADPTAGDVRCGGLDLRAVDLEQWRSRIAWVPQHPTAFTGTIAENVALGVDSCHDEELRAAVRAAGLDELVAELPDGVQTVIGEGGRRLSSGQLQRVALARAFLRDAALVVLDEPTAHLDQESATLIGATIERLARGRTMLLIVHDGALARRADLVVQVQAGRIVSSVRAPAELAAA